MASKRRTLKQAYKEDSSPELESFVFGDSSDTSPAASKPVVEEPEFGAEIVVPISRIHKTFSFTPNRKPVRYYYDQDELRNWAETDIKPNGVRTALWTRPMPGKPGEYELVAGLRRLTACNLIATTEVPIKVFDWDDEEAYAAAFDENDKRRDFSKLEEVDIILNLLSKKLGMELDEVVSLLYRMDNQAKGKVTQSDLGNGSADIVESFFTTRGQLTWRSFVATRLPLLKKPADILDAIRSSKISYTKAIEISKLKDPQERQALIDETINQRLPLSKVKQRVKLSTKPKEAKEQPGVALKSRFKSTLRQMDKANIWTDSGKADKLQKLISQIEELLA